MNEKALLKMGKEPDPIMCNLQELARKRKSLAAKHLTDDQKRKIVQANLVDHVPLTKLSKEYGICRQSIWRWIDNFASGKGSLVESPARENSKQNQKPMPKKRPSKVESPEEELARLRAENKRLSEALQMAEWSNHAKDVMIDLAEKTFNIPIRKNLVPNSERACRGEGQGTDDGPSLPAVWQELAGLLSA
ncbi:helix-turn-helix domain-containing protein [Parabacteroides distasonis]|nr:helix-turn-helix domain-containing protein [Parabacteroides distasonis]